MKKSIKILIIVLSLIIVGLIVFIIVDKVTNNNNASVENSTVENVESGSSKTEDTTKLLNNDVNADNTTNSIENTINTTNSNIKSSNIINETSGKNVTSNKSTTQTEKSNSIFEGTSSLNYTSNLKDDENGKIAILKMGEDTFKSEVKDGYYIYVDNFNNSYNIKEITEITSKYSMTGNDNWAILFKCTIKYIDENNSTKSFDTAVIVPTDGNGAHLITPFDNYTGSTSFVRGFTDLYEEE